jgi:hypothetical protein
MRRRSTGLLPEGFALIAQRGDAFGERLLAAAQDILSCGYRFGVFN